MIEKIVISLGGSLIVPGTIDVEYIREFKQRLIKHKKGRQFYIVAGGGKTARHYIEAAALASSPEDISDDDKDWLGIHCTRLNAHLLRTIFCDFAHPRIVKDPSIKVGEEYPVVIAAGYRPGYSTDCIAVRIAQTQGVETVVNLTNTDYAYDKDPRTFKDAKPLTQIAWSDFQKIVGEKWTPGLNAPFDPIASKEAAENKLRVIIANGKNLDNLERIILRKEYVGTTIS